MREDIENLKQRGARDLRNFGLMVGGVFCALALWFYLRHKPFYWYVLLPGVPLVVLGGLFPRSLKWVYVVWMTLAMLIGGIVSTVLLALLFYLVITPIGLIARLAGNDFLSRKLAPEATSYWILRDISKPKQTHEHEQQF